jgi:hypothetical protein
MQAITNSSLARRAAAETLANGLQQLKPPPTWMLELAMVFANDDDESVGKAILQAFDGNSDHLLNLPDFFTKMAQSKAAKQDPQDMLELCCKSGDIVALADDVIVMITGLTEINQTDDNHWRLASTADVAMNALQTLVAKAEQQGSTRVRNQALDVWDRLIERGLPLAQQKLNNATDFGIGL